MTRHTFTSNSPSDTGALAAALATLLKGGEIITFSGPIGAGKTVFVSALVRALGLNARPVSASFSLMKEYKGAGLRVFHADLFRLEENEMHNFGLEEMLSDEKAIILVEWPAAADNFLPQGRLELDFKLLEGDGREITFNARGADAENALRNLCQKI